MWMGLLFSAGCYMLGVALLHLVYVVRRRKGGGTGARSGTGKLESGPGSAKSILIITKNNQLYIEWYIRSLFFFSWLKGRRIAAAVLDESSTDDTLKIIERLSYKHAMDVRTYYPIMPLDEYIRHHYPEDVTIVRPSSRPRLTKLPI